MVKYTSFQDIPQFTQARYCVDVAWCDLESWLERASAGGLELNPDFQRGHVWTEDKQIAYVEFCLSGGRGAHDIMLNHPGWMKSFVGVMQLVDGLQRVTSVRRFLRGDIPAFGRSFCEYSDRLHMTGPGFRIHVNDLPTRADVLRWYLELNSGGVVHTKEELSRVRALLEAE